MSLEIYEGDHPYPTACIFSEDYPVNFGITLDKVTKIYADEIELKKALAISGLPQYGATMFFVGDMAKHILYNWK